MESSEIRSQFLEYFISKEHALVKSSPLIPKDDPTLLFTNAGMVQFKRVFLGEEMRPYSRATSCQKCIRAGGKHSDLENVGFTARHHTFFEMLGNFSFGDYFKREAILFAWELLTEHFKLPKEKLWVSIFREDDEAADIWHREIGVAEERIVRLGEKDNFWQMGDTGPCGPCSEIIIDQGEDFGCKRPDCSVGCDCDRFLELWNLVFMQYNRELSGKLTPLPKPSIDTGMGLERITAVMQGKRTNFDTDLFEPIINKICSTFGVKYGSERETDVSIKVIADHVRAATFLISEGLIPSNEGRGYVLRRIIRRAGRHVRLLGYDRAALFEFVEPVVEKLGEIYRELVSEYDRVKKVLKVEEERFIKSLERAEQVFEDIVSQVKSSNLSIIPGEEVFRLYDTYGLPLDLIREMARDSELGIDEQGFHRELTKQRERARGAQKLEDISTGQALREVSSRLKETVFRGYDEFELETKVVAIIKDGATLKSLGESEEGELFLLETPFYAESGGQVGDSGLIISKRAKLEVIDTKKIGKLHSHRVRVLEGSVEEGDEVFAKIDAERRRDIMRNHTATHLLHASLRAIVGDHVKQAGSLVAPDRLRFDFTHFEGLSQEELSQIEHLVNEKILENLNVTTEIKPLDEALKEGVIALFEDKYEEMVRVVRIHGFSKELCGGTHCKSTGEIGCFFILSEGSVASGIRRIEAITGFNALRYTNQLRYKISQISNLLKSSEPLSATERLLEELKEKQREIDTLKDRLISQSIDSLVSQAREIGGVKALAVKVEGVEAKELRTLSDKLREKLSPSVILLVSKLDSQGLLLLTVTKDITNRFDAGKLLKEIVSEVGGKGGGKPESAQGGCPDGEALDRVIGKFYELLAKN